MAKGKAVWWVLKQADEVLVPLYKGPDKKRAREVAAKISTKRERIPHRCARLFTHYLSESHLKQHLPKDAFSFNAEAGSEARRLTPIRQ